MRHGTTYECLITVPSLQYTDETTPRILIGQSACIASEMMVKGSGDPVISSGHGSAFMFAGIKATTNQAMNSLKEGAVQYGRT